MGSYLPDREGGVDAGGIERGDDSSRWRLGPRSAAYEAGDSDPITSCSLRNVIGDVDRPLVEREPGRDHEDELGRGR